MPDIQLRFNKDMLVLSAPLDATLKRQGIDAALDRQYLNLMEPDSIRDALMLEVAAGAQCIVTATEDITRARLSHLRMDADDAKLAQAALSAAQSARPQHVLAEIGPCGLPLDASSKASLNENRKQYADAARAFEGGQFDAYFLNGFTSLADLKCALMGAAQVAERPVFASVVLGSRPPRVQKPDARDETAGSAADDPIAGDSPFGGYSPVKQDIAPPLPVAARSRLDPADWPEAIAVMADLGTSVVGFETDEPIEAALAYARTAAEQTDLPLLAQLRVTEGNADAVGKNLVPLADIDEYTPDTMVAAAVKLYGAGVQFLRATGSATASYTGSLAATVTGLDVVLR